MYYMEFYTGSGYCSHIIHEEDFDSLQMCKKAIDDIRSSTHVDHNTEKDVPNINGYGIIYKDGKYLMSY